MKKTARTVIIAILSLFMLNSLSYSQTDEYDRFHSRYDLSYRTFRIALVPGISTNGFNAPEYASKYSWNIVAGYNGALDRGFELGGLLNMNKFYAHGGQIAGLGNYSGLETRGIQFAGVFNYSGEEMQGIQFSGITNISRDEMQGIQISGVLNKSGDSSQGIQMAGLMNLSSGEMQGFFLSGAGNIASQNMQGIMASGIVNYTKSDMQGISASGLLNYSYEMQGISFATVNINKYMQGLQFGGINISREAQGIQVGIINYGEELQGAPVGLISYYKENGRNNIDFWTSDAGFTNIGIKLGTQEIYNMISVGFNPAIDRDVWQVGWSIGRLHEYKTHTLYTDFSIFKINEGEWNKDLNSLFKYRLLFGKELTNGLHVYGGPTLNMLISRETLRDDYTWYRLLDFGAKGREYIFWIGYSLGIQLF